MAVVCDLRVIQGDKSKKIGDGRLLWEKKFQTGGRYPGGHAVLMLMVKGLTATESDVVVKINNKPVGHIFNYNGANKEHWFTQIIEIAPNILKKNGENELQIEAVSFPDASASNLFDDFYLRDVIVLFQQES